MAFLSNISLDKMNRSDCVNFDPRVMEAIREHYSAKTYYTDDDWAVCEYLNKLGENDLRIPRWVYEIIREEFIENSSDERFRDGPEDDMVCAFLLTLEWELFDYYYSFDPPSSKDECTASAVKDIKWNYTYEYFLLKKYNQMCLDAASQILRKFYGDDWFSIGESEKGVVCLVRDKKRWKVYSNDFDAKNYYDLVPACFDLISRAESSTKSTAEASSEFYDKVAEINRAIDREYDDLRAEMEAGISIKT